MKVRYDSEVDIMLITFKERPILESGELEPGLIADYDSDGNIVRLEILNASTKIEDASVMNFASLVSGKELTTAAAT